ncbi:S-adenosyl-L-methionine-dependent methyltransferase [Xylaria intraflava]|nr:S-adenosyl-L-methionine-dependent methyltransferase [Xylaria intraflava]
MANLPDNTYDPANFWHRPERNFRTSGRLYIQHYLTQKTIGCLLDPRVEKSIDASKPLAVADLGCGNGVWLIDLERDLSKKGISARLDGYDINVNNFPAAAFIPESITLKKLDILSQLPKEILGTYDIVHIRAFQSIIVNQDVTPLLSAVLALLKPGGWIQWEEPTAGKFLIDTPSPDVPKIMCETISHILEAGGKARGLNFDFIHHVDRILKEHGFGDVHMETNDQRREDMKGWTDNYLTVWEDLHELFPLKADNPQAPMTREMWADMFAKAVSETEHGVVIHHGQIMLAVGRKAL